MHHCHAKIAYLFLDIGIVIAWQLSKRINFDDVKNLLMSVNDCYKEHKNENLEFVFLDTATTATTGEKRIESVFGKVPFKLDWFHAIQRFVSTLARKSVTDDSFF